MSESGAPEAPLFLMGPKPAALIAFGTALAGVEECLIADPKRCQKVNHFRPLPIFAQIGQRLQAGCIF